MTENNGGATTLRELLAQGKQKTACSPTTL